MARHARLGPSSSDIWLTCLQAPAEWAKRPPKRVGFHAHEGSLAHALCEAAIKINAIPWKAGMTFDVDGEPITITDEMLDAVALFTSTVGALSEACLWRIVESEVSLGWLWEKGAPERVFGTADFGACDGFTLYVCDFKYGAGKAVKVDRNTQLLCYALGILGRLKIERPDLADTIENVCVMIVQPRAGGSAVRTWTINIADLIYWGYAVLKSAVDQITSGRELPLVSGSHCFFCAASIDCPEYHKLRNAKVKEAFPDDLTLDELEPV